MGNFKRLDVPALTRKHIDTDLRPYQDAAALPPLSLSNAAALPQFDEKYQNTETITVSVAVEEKDERFFTENAEKKRGLGGASSPRTRCSASVFV